MATKNIAASLFAKTPQQSSIDTTTKQQAVPGSYMNVEVDKIEFFDKNPRKHRDDESYAQIKASIRASGVQHPVHITQRPDSDRYVLAQGGNTRLSIVKELWAETNDIRFASIPCIYVEYTDETSIQIAHLIENEQRSEMCFWDKAQAYSEIRDIFQNSSGKKLSLRDCETVFATHGLSVSKGLLSWLFFASDKLQALGELTIGLSIAKTNEISKCYNDLKKRCKDSGKPEQDFEDWFVIALRDFAQYSESATELDTESLLNHLEQSFSDYFDIQTANLFEEESSPDTVNTPLPESTLSGNHEQEIATETQKERSHSGSGVSRDKTPRIPKEYSYGVSEPVNDDNEQETATAITLPESTLSGSHEQEIATDDNANTDWHSVLHQQIKELLAIVNLSDCFVLSNLFPLGFYVEYPDFEQLKKLPTSKDMPVPFVIDKLHRDAGDILFMVIKISGQENFLHSIEEIENNPILQLPKSSFVLKEFQDDEFRSHVEWAYLGARPMLPNKMINWLSNPNANRTSILVNNILNSLRHITTGA